MRNRRNTIRLNESMLKRIIKESVKRVLRESNEKQEIFTLDATDITLDDAIDEEKCDLSYYKHAAYFFEFLLGILDEAEFFSTYDEISIDVNNYLYWEVS